jgi:AcrR family transcriptional regulator
LSDRTARAGRPPVRAGAPNGEEEVRAALVDAATELFAEHGPAGVSVRQIATRAGVNHGLVHYYFGAKDDLLAAVLDRCAAAAADAFARGDDVALLLDRESAVARHARILAHVVLAAGDPAAMQHEFPTQRRLVDWFRTRGVPVRDARVRAAQVSALVLGWHLFGDFLTTAAGVDRPGDRRRVAREGVERLLSSDG